MKTSEVKHVKQRRYSMVAGTIYGRMTLTGECEMRGAWLYLECLCECGKTVWQVGNKLASGHTSSCGCRKNEIAGARFRTHGQTGTRLHQTWKNMKARCYNKAEKSFDDYGGRGIVVCPKWVNNFQAFFRWAIASGYTDDLTIERREVNGDYEPGNCLWIPAAAQQTNTRRNVFISAFGDTKTLVEWSRDSRCAVAYHTLKCRVGRDRSKWEPEAAISTPPGKAQRNIRFQ